MDRLTEILSSKEFKKIPPITEAKTERMCKASARYMFVADKNNRKHGICERCCQDVEFEKKTKHKEIVVCPNCNHTMTVEHVYRKKGCDLNADFFMEGKAISSDVFVLRYYEVYQFDSYKQRVKEVAREIFDFKSHKRFRVEWDDWKKIWDKGNFYFVEFNMYNRRKAFCLTASLLQTKKQLVKETRKIKALEYYDFENKIGTYYCLTNDYVGLLSGQLYEKMEKVGLGKLVDEDFGNGKIKWNGKATSLVKMLRLDKRRYKMLTSETSVEELKFLQSYKNIAKEELLYLRDKYNGFSDYRKFKMKGVKNPIKAMKYLDNHNYINYQKNKVQHVGSWEYGVYLSNLKELEYNLNDSYYLCPKDFRKADVRVANELVEQRKRLAKEKQVEKDMLIKKISDGLRNMDDLKEFMGGSNGLLVYVPESAEDLITEGRKLHNCIGSYVDRVAENKTLVFFVRRLNAPNDPFVAFEYCNGEVIQCRYDHNEAVEDDKIINFVDAFAERLRKNNVLYKAA